MGSYQIQAEVQSEVQKQSNDAQEKAVITITDGLTTVAAVLMDTHMRATVIPGRLIILMSSLVVHMERTVEEVGILFMGDKYEISLLRGGEEPRVDGTSAIITIGISSDVISKRSLRPDLVSCC
ncbi:unnamed protein product [Cylicostephanus goldi]|uniref:Uncharacterized protein n=1 Tax=Cylicostephanus goldi TaxID=71465 RepID=A0A3P7LVX4_CYLGO|nr:unnamed protein product [Cylicostephanus goldi]